MSAADDCFSKAAEMATELAAQWRADSAMPGADAEWIVHCTIEEQHALDRAAWYLSRKQLLETPIPPFYFEEPITHV